MNTIEDFENAPVGATATSRDGRHMYRREAETPVGADWVRGEGDGRLWADAEGLAHYGYTLGPALTAPTTAREALDLAWDLALPEGGRMSDFKKMMKALDEWLDNVRDEYVTAFDQWLNEARAEAWEEGHEAASLRVPEGVWHDTASPRLPNPYRQEQDQ